MYIAAWGVLAARLMSHHSPSIIRSRGLRCLKGCRLHGSTSNGILGLGHYGMPYLCIVALDHDNKDEPIDSHNNSNFS